MLWIPRSLVLFLAMISPSWGDTPEGRSCSLTYEIPNKCFACPAAWHTKKKCERRGSGWSAVNKKSGGCGFLSAGCRGWCEKKATDYGCGCDKGTGCLDFDCVMGDWSAWSACKDPRTGQILSYDQESPKVYGVQTRTREVLSEAQNNGAECGAGGQELSCHSHEPNCATYAWKDWSACSKTCGIGTQMRSRVGSLNGVPTECPLKETRSCHEAHCYHFMLLGINKDEIVDITDGTKTTRYKMKKTKKFGVNNRIVQVNFVNGPDKIGSRGLLFDWEDRGTITSCPNWNEWNCGAYNENQHCKDVRKVGKFYWGGTYELTFNYNDEVQGCADC